MMIFFLWLILMNSPFSFLLLFEIRKDIIKKTATTFQFSVILIYLKGYCKPFKVEEIFWHILTILTDKQRLQLYIYRFYFQSEWLPSPGARIHLVGLELRFWEHLSTLYSSSHSASPSQWSPSRDFMNQRRFIILRWYCKKTFFRNFFLV